MPEQSHSGANGRLNVAILYEGVVIGQGQMRSTSADRAFVETRDFPLGANSFLELVMHSEGNTRVNIPVRVQRNTGDGLEVELEGTNPGILAALFWNEH